MGSYVHGYTPRESERLSDQSDILEAVLHDGVVYGAGERVLEAGCGVGAQTEILTRRSPRAQFVSVDISEDSLRQAEERIRGVGRRDVRFERANICELPFEDAGFDHVFVCFVLEHLDDPLVALAELQRVLREGGTLTVIEGDHSSAFWNPETAASRRVWECLVTAQQALGHDPLIGRRLYPLLTEAGYRVEAVEPRWIYVGRRRPCPAVGSSGQDHGADGRDGP